MDWRLTTEEIERIARVSRRGQPLGYSHTIADAATAKALREVVAWLREDGHADFELAADELEKMLKAGDS